jgi:hypothetical protein
MTTDDMTETRARRWRWETLTGGTAILQNEDFRRLWLGRILSHTALNAVLYSLLVLAVGEGSGTSIKSALFISAYLLPTATLGTISGVMVDKVPKNLLLAAVNIGRLGLMLVLLVAEADIWTIYTMALFIAVTSQFAAPAEAAALPQMVRREELTTANSTSNLGGLISQVVGFAVLPPLFLNTIGAKPLFLVAAVLFGAGAAFFLSIRRLGARQIDIDSTIEAVREVRKQFAQAWERLKEDLAAYMSVIIVVLASTASLVAVTLMPRFAQDVLDIPVENAIFVFVPAALGILAGLRLVQLLERRLPKPWLVGIGFSLLAASLLGLALVRPLAGALEALNPLALFDPGPFGDTTANILVTIVFSTTAAFSFSVVGVASRSLVNARMPLEIQGRVFAAQHVLTNLASIPPILLAGLLAELFGVEMMLFLAVFILVGAAGWTAAQAIARSAS